MHRVHRLTGTTREVVRGMVDWDVQDDDGLNPLLATEENDGDDDSGWLEPK